MTSLTQKFSKLSLGAAMRVVTLALFVVVFGASAALAQTRGYVTNSSDGTVSVIDPATNTVVATIPVGSGPREIAITPNGAFAYVANYSSATVSVIDTTTNTVTTTVATGVVPSDVAITPNGAFAYVSAGGNTVKVIDTGTNTLVATVPVGQTPLGIAVDPNGTFAYVANINANTVSKISTTTNTVVATIPVGSRPIGIAFAPASQGPTDKDQCKDGGWATFTNPTFSNQGQCVSYINHLNH